jgi:hypothetical protein
MQTNKQRNLSWPVRRRVWLNGILTWLTGGLILICITIGFFSAAALNFKNGNYLFGVISTVVFGFFCWLLYKVIFSKTKIRIIPYFSNRVPEADTFLYGHAIAANSRTLDEIAKAKSLKPLCTFGFKDDRTAQRLIWHNPDDGIKTVEALLAQVQEDAKNFFDSDTLVSDLNRMLVALKAVQVRKLKFCLLVWIGDAVSLMEMDQRKGFVHDEWKCWSPTPEEMKRKKPVKQAS